MNKQELKLFNSKNPQEYIDNSLKVKLTPGRKAYITRLWLTKRKYTIEDIKKARNRHPYWKKKKMEGSSERNEQRRQEHDYRKHGTLEWNEDTIKEFIQMNKKDKRGNYIHKDYELAQHFNTTIPSIQHYRRKFNMAVAYLDKKKQGITAKRIFELVSNSEQKLRNLLKPKKKVKSAAKKSVKKSKKK